VRLIPDLAIYLDVSPEVAQSRKKEYSFEKMVELNSMYKEYMAERAECVFVNADQNIESVYKTIIGLIDERITKF
jgi:thymidylate kinase